MADMAPAPQVREYRAQNPDALIVAYVNTTAETKAEVDICCTSANAARIVASLPSDRRIMFLPDQNLGANVAKETGRKMELWRGFCPTHNRVMPEMISAARAAHPGAELLVHPECRPDIVALADHALSTGGILRHARESKNRDFIIGTEKGILHRLRQENPAKNFYALEPEMLCPNMKKISLEHLRNVLAEDADNALTDDPRVIEIAPEIRARARAPIDKMLALK
jgi:quinolinate synthase